MKPYRRALFYLGYVAAWTAVIVAAGAFIGAIAFPVVGKIAGSAVSVLALAGKGARDLGFLAFIWAPGTAIVMAFQHAWKRRQAAPGPGSGGRSASSPS